MNNNRETLINSLRATKNWTTDYAESFVDDYADEVHQTKPLPELILPAGWIAHGIITYEEKVEEIQAKATQKERERCTLVCDTIGAIERRNYKNFCEPYSDGKSDGAYDCAVIIRANIKSV